MKGIRYYKSIFSIIFCLFFLSFIPNGEIWAQNGSDTKKPDTVTLCHASGYKVTFLTLGCGLGSTAYRDDGTAPIKYNGIGVPLTVGLKWGGMRKVNFKLLSTTSIGVCKQSFNEEISIDAFDIFNYLRAKVSFSNNEVLYGIALTNFLDVTVNPNYQNAAVGVSDFLGPELSIGTDYYLSKVFVSDFFENKSVHAEFAMMPLAAVLRPGYSYIDNYTAEQPVIASTFSSYQWGIQPFASISTNLGFRIHNDTFSSICISYLWSFHLYDMLKMHLDENYSGPSPFRHSYHLLSLDFDICMKAKKACHTSISKR